MRPPKALHMMQSSRGCLYLWCLIAALRHRLIKMCVVCAWNELLKGMHYLKNQTCRSKLDAEGKCE